MPISVPTFKNCGRSVLELSAMENGKCPLGQYHLNGYRPMIRVDLSELSRLALSFEGENAIAERKACFCRR